MDADRLTISDAAPGGVCSSPLSTSPGAGVISNARRVNEVRIKVSDADFRSAERALEDLEREHGRDLAAGRMARRRRGTVETVVEAAPTMAELNAEAWRRARGGR